jgi:hypothetical protein
MAKGRKMVYGDQGITMNFAVNHYNESDQSRAIEMGGTTF